MHKMVHIILASNTGCPVQYGTGGNPSCAVTINCKELTHAKQGWSPRHNVHTKF
jgi:hypothetical protein